uniref:Uncharacterized protein n=1 Tax=Chenopodium quinoa TaxID=63459 RepID=A0A803L0J8_CHEQI
MINAYLKVFDGQLGGPEGGYHLHRFNLNGSSFQGVKGLKSPVSAEEVFEDGQIRVISPFPGEYSGEGETSSSSTYGRTVKNVFVVSNSPENDDVAEEGSYCVWKAPSPEMSQKSNSTGFSKLRKMRDLLARSNSDGKDAFVFLNGKTDASGKM